MQIVDDTKVELFYGQKTNEEEKAREKELNDLFKVVVSQPKVPISVYFHYEH